MNLNKEFSGAKIALLCGDQVLVYLRDDKPSIPFPNKWDLAGGGREGDETPEQCVMRETFEEFGLKIRSSRIVWKRRYDSATLVGEHAYFMAAKVTERELAEIKFGDEGQFWQLMTTSEFINHPDAIPQLQVRLAAYLSEGRRQ